MLERTDVRPWPVYCSCASFVIDKIPILHSAWDLVHTVARPVVGAAIGVLMVHHAHGSPTEAVAATVLGCGTALASHAVNVGARIGVYTSPEPVSNGIPPWTR